MPERRRSNRRGRRPSETSTATDSTSEPNPYREGDTSPSEAGASPDSGGDDSGTPAAKRPRRGRTKRTAENTDGNSAEADSTDASNGSDAPHRSAESVSPPNAPAAERPQQEQQQQQQQRQQHQPRQQHGGRNQPRNEGHRGDENHSRRNGRRGRRNRRGHRTGGGEQGKQQQIPSAPVTVDGTTKGWFDTAREGGFVRLAENSYLTDPGDAFLPPALIKQHGLRPGDVVEATTGKDHRGRVVCAEVTLINDTPVDAQPSRPDFASLTATYPERRLTLETGRPAKAGPELTRRAIDLMAPIGYGQRGLIVAPARAGKTMLLHAITEGIALNHPEAVLLILLVDERPEEVSEAISWGVGEVVSSSFDQPAKRHVEVCEIVLEHARRMVELGRDVVIVLDSLTRMARAHNTAERGTGRTMSGGLDTSAMAKPKAFFGSARSVSPKDGGGSLSIIATALVETGSRMDDVIFEEFKGTGNCEIKLDRALSEKRIFPAFDIAASGTRREEKLYKAEQLEAIYTLRRGLQQMPPQAAMEWMIKRIAGTANNDALLEGL